MYMNGIDIEERYLVIYSSMREYAIRDMDHGEEIMSGMLN